MWEMGFCVDHTCHADREHHHACVVLVCVTSGESFLFGEKAPYKSWMDALNLCFCVDLKDAASLMLWKQSEVKKMTLSEAHKDSEMSRFICVNLGNDWKNAGVEYGRLLGNE